MTEDYLAHSAKGEHQGQGYGEHVEETTKLALHFLSRRGRRHLQPERRLEALNSYAEEKMDAEQIR